MMNVTTTTTTTQQKQRKVIIIEGKRLEDAYDLLPISSRRNALRMTHSLICSLFRQMKLPASNLTLMEAIPATETEMRAFHSSGYLRVLKGSEDSNDIEELEEYNLVDDCSSFPGIWEHVSMITGASLLATQLLIENKSIAINWSGGRHHAKDDEASGFCYINDIVLSLLKLTDYPSKSPFQKALYIDCDIHHSDGVSEAFYHSNNVATLSFHRYAPGFFPCTGKLSETGSGEGKGFNINVPIQGAIDDESYFNAFAHITDACKKAFKPNVIVFVVGTDEVSGDEIGIWGLSSDCILKCVQHIMDWSIPTLLLGGGGYNKTTISRCFASITAMVATSCATKLPDDIPDDNDYFELYSDHSFSLHVPACEERCLMTIKHKEILNHTIEQILKRLSEMK